MNLPQRLADAGRSDSTALQRVTNSRPVPARLSRAVDKAVAVEHGRGIVAAARVRAVERVATEALQAVGQLSQLEAFWAQQVPHATGRLLAIGDVAAMTLAGIVHDTGRE